MVIFNSFLIFLIKKFSSSKIVFIFVSQLENIDTQSFNKLNLRKMKCCLCHNEIIGYPHNAEPIMNGQCCSDCNTNIVIPNRISQMKVLRDAAIAQATFEKGMMELNGYEVVTTLYQDFTIADAFGVDAVRDTYNRVFKEWKHSVEFMTELSLVLNHKIWEHWHKEKNSALSIAYDTLWKQQDEWCMTNLSDEDMTYYVKITD